MDLAATRFGRVEALQSADAAPTSANIGVGRERSSADLLGVAPLPFVTDTQKQ
jgi:hypothetical protein